MHLLDTLSICCYENGYHVKGIQVFIIIMVNSDDFPLSYLKIAFCL